MATIGKVSAVFSASTSGLTSGVNQAGRSLDRLQGQMRSVSRATNAIAAIQIGSVFASIGRTVFNYASSLVSLGQAQAQVIDRQSKLAQAIGIADAELASLALAGELAGVGLETVGTAANKLNVAIGRAGAGNKAAQASFAQLGLSFQQLESLSPADQFAKIAERISRLPAAADKAAAAVAIFGRAGAELLPLFDGGAAGIEAAAFQAQRLGLALTDEQANSVEKMNDSLTLVGKSFTGIIQQVTAYLAPVIDELATTFTTLLGDIGGANIGQAIGDGILTGARYLAQVGDSIIAYLGPLFANFGTVAGQWDSVGLRLQQVAAVFKAVFDRVVAELLFAARLVGTVAEGIANILSYVPGLGATADAAIAATRAFNENIDGQIADRLRSASENIDFALTPIEVDATAAANSIGAALTPIEVDATAATDSLRNAVGPIQVDATAATDSLRSAIGPIEVDATAATDSLRAGIGPVVVDATEATESIGAALTPIQVDATAATESLRTAIGPIRVDATAAAESLRAAASAQALPPGQASQAGQAIAGPLESALNAAIEKARNAASGITANPIRVDGADAAQQIREAIQTEAVQGIDSRSSEGVREMFRIMRGSGGSDPVQEEQRDLLEQIAQNTGGAGLELATANF